MVYVNCGRNVINAADGKNCINGGLVDDILYFGRGDHIVVGSEVHRDRAFSSNTFTSRMIIDALEINSRQEINSMQFRDLGKYVVVESASGRLSYIRQATETISSYNGRNSVTFQSALESVRLDVSDPD